MKYHELRCFAGFVAVFECLMTKVLDKNGETQITQTDTQIAVATGCMGDVECAAYGVQNTPGSEYLVGIV